MSFKDQVYSDDVIQAIKIRFDEKQVDFETPFDTILNSLTSKIANPTVRFIVKELSILLTDYLENELGKCKIGLWKKIVTFFKTGKW